MHAQIRPDGAIVLTIEDEELVDVESALMNGEEAARICMKLPNIDLHGRDDCRDAAEWLEKLAEAIGSAQGHSRDPNRPKLRLV